MKSSSLSDNTREVQSSFRPVGCSADFATHSSVVALAEPSHPFYVKSNVGTSAGSTRARERQQWGQTSPFRERSSSLTCIPGRPETPKPTASQRRNTEVRLTHRWRDQIRTFSPTRKRALSAECEQFQSDREKTRTPQSTPFSRGTGSSNPSLRNRSSTEVLPQRRRILPVCDTIQGTILDTISGEADNSAW